MIVGTLWGAAVAVSLGLAMLVVAVRWPRFGLAAALLGTVALHGLLLDHHVDDAGIVYAYAENLALGRGLVAQPGGAVVEGFSDPLWVALLAVTRILGVVPSLASKALQLGLALVAVLGAGAVAHRACPGRRGVSVTMALVASTGVWVAWSTAGLEGALFGALLVLATWAAAAGGTGWVVALVVACAWTRPEGAVAGLAAAAAGFVVAGQPRRIVWAALGSGIGLASLHGVRLAWLGTWLPNSATAKLSPSGWTVLRGGAYAGWSAVQAGWIVLVLGAMSRLGRGRWIPAALVGGTALLLAVASGGDWMRHGRFLAPYVPVLAGLLVPVSLACAGGRGAERILGRLGFSAAALTGLAVLGHAVWAATVPVDHGLRRGALYVALSEGCGDSVATPDVGGVVYGWPGVRVVDLAGLLDAEAAELGREPGYWAARLGADPVSIVDLHGRWAERTGLSDGVMADLGYRVGCRRGAAPDTPTLWLAERCVEPDGEAQRLLDAWCADGSGVPWPGEVRVVFP